MKFVGVMGVAAVSALALTLSGCGSQSSATEATPAETIPAASTTVAFLGRSDLTEANSTEVMQEANATTHAPNLIAEGSDDPDGWHGRRLGSVDHSV